MTGSLEITLRVLSNTYFGGSSLKFIYNFCSFLQQKLFTLITLIENIKKNSTQHYFTYFLFLKEYYLFDGFKGFLYKFWS